MKRLLFAFLACILFVAHIGESQSCDSYSTEISCGNTGSSCKWVNGKCRCASEVQLDILFGVDTSGSIGYNGFQIQKQFINGLVTQGIANGSRIGFIMFSTTINFSEPIDYWQASDLEQYVSGLYWTAGWTNTPELMAAALPEFARVYDAARQQVMIMITDGNPCLPDSLGGCPQSVCQYQEQVKKAGIRVVIIGVGDGLNTAYVSCLTQSDDDFIPVSSFSTEDFNSILGSLSGILCPISKEFKVTEVKAQKKSAITQTSSAPNERWVRFVEVYNSGIDFTLDDIYITGMIEMSLGAGLTTAVSQGQYVVFFDASDLAASSSPTGALDVPSCHLCSSVCTLDVCTTDGVSSWLGSCFCDNSIYVACSNTDSGGVTNCQSTVSAANSGTYSIFGQQGLTVVDGCSVCTFQDTTKTSWNVEFGDDGADPVDTVTYDSTTWITTDDGYSYELIAKGFDNDVGDNWAQSCSVLGTPGSDPAATCTEVCTSNGCGGGATCLATGLCDCSSITGYYPQCTSPTSCTKCLEVPTVMDCNVTWIKNISERFANYEWTKVERSSNTEYRLTYYDANAQNVPLETYSLAAKITNYDTGNMSYGGYVETKITVCDANNACTDYYSQKTMCNVLTSAPTASPTAAPTDSTQNPTASPTMPPSVMTLIPSLSPSLTPTDSTQVPSASPTVSPTAPTLPSLTPSSSPSLAPTVSTSNPSATPTVSTSDPSAMPTVSPSAMPSMATSETMETTETTETDEVNNNSAAYRDGCHVACLLSVCYLFLRIY